MEEYQEDIGRIKAVLRDHPKGLSITDIADLIDVNRNSVAKYMDILQIQGAVDGYRVGTSKLYILSSRLPSHAIPEVCTRPFLLIDRGETVTDTNRGMADLLGLPRDHIIGREFGSLSLKIHETGDEKRAVRGAMRGTSLQAKGRITSATGRLHEVSLLLEPVVFENGLPGAALIVSGPEVAAPVTDITGAFSDILALLDDEMEYVVRYTPDGTIRFVNETYCRAAGKTKEDFVSRAFRPLVSPEDALRIEEHRGTLSAKNPVGFIEFKAVMAGGEVRWQRWKDRALFNDRGELTGYQSCGLDITRYVELKNELNGMKEQQNELVLKRTEELRATNRQLYSEISSRDKFEQRLLRTQYVMDHSADSVFLISRAGSVRYANKRAEEILGYPEEELLNGPVSAILPKGIPDPLPEFMDNLRKSGPYRSDASLVAKNREHIPAEILFTYLRYHGEDFICCLARDRPESPVTSGEGR